MTWTTGAPNKSSDGPSDGSVPITTSDTTVLSPPTRGLYVGGTGDVKVRMAGDGSTPTFVGVPAGTVLPVSVDKVLATGTTATSIIGML